MKIIIDKPNDFSMGEKFADDSMINKLLYVKTIYDNSCLWPNWFYKPYENEKILIHMNKCSLVRYFDDYKLHGFPEHLAERWIEGVGWQKSETFNDSDIVRVHPYIHINISTVNRMIVRFIEVFRDYIEKFNSHRAFYILLPSYEAYVCAIYNLGLNMPNVNNPEPVYEFGRIKFSFARVDAEKLVPTLSPVSGLESIYPSDIKFPIVCSEDRYGVYYGIDVNHINLCEYDKIISFYI